MVRNITGFTCEEADDGVSGRAGGRSPGNEKRICAHHSGRAGAGRVIQRGRETAELSQVDVRQPHQTTVRHGQMIRNT